MKESNIRRCDGCGKWVLHEVLCDICAHIYARMIA